MSILRTRIENRSLYTINGSTVKMKVFIAMLSIIFLLSCKDSGTPAGVLSKAEMVQVLTDVYITEEKVKILNLPLDSSRAVFNVMKERIYSEAGTTDSIYQLSYEYYLDHPKEMELIYTALVDSLQLKEQRTQQVESK